MTNMNEPKDKTDLNGIKNVEIATPNLTILPLEGDMTMKVDESHETSTGIRNEEVILEISAIKKRDSHRYREAEDDKNIEDCRVAYFENKAAMDRGDKPIHDIPRIKVWHDNITGEFVLLGGNHRVEGATRAGCSTIEAIVYHCTEDAAYEIGAQDNASHGLKLSKGDKKVTIKKTLQRFPDISLRRIADLLKCGLSTVSEAASELYKEGLLERPEKRRGKDGKEYITNRGSKGKEPKADTPRKSDSKLTSDQAMTLDEIIVESKAYFDDRLQRLSDAGERHTYNSSMIEWLLKNDEKSCNIVSGL